MKKIEIKIICILIAGYLLLFQDYACSQSYLVHTYAEDDGLPSSTVFDIAQDSSGRMWFATRGGIAVYDGVQWKTYTVADGLPAMSYFKIKVDEQGIIWAFTELSQKCISYFDGNRWLSISKPEALKHPGSVTAFAVTFFNDKRYIALGTQTNGVYLYADSLWTQITADNGLLSCNVNSIIACKNQFYVATDKGISVINGSEIDNSLNESIILPSSNVLGIAVETKAGNKSGSMKIWLMGRYWVGFVEEGIFKLISNTVKTVPDKRVHYLILQPDYRGGLYYGNTSNLCYIDGKTGSIEYLDRESGLISEGATSLYWDRESNLWISSLRGVSKISSKRFANYRKIHGLLDNEVTAILEREPGKFVFGHKNGLSFFDGKNFETRTFLKKTYASDAETRVLDICMDSQKNIWVAVSHLGLAKIDKSGSLKWCRENGRLFESVTSVSVDPAGTVWASAGNQLYVLKGKEFIQTSTAEIKAGYIRKIIQGYNSLFLATPGMGVIAYECNKWKQYINASDRTANNVYSVLQDSKGRIWVGTLAGLYRLQNNAIIKFYLNDFEINRPVYTIVEDKKGRLWFGTDNGAIRWDGQNYREYTVHQGFAGQETNRAAGIVDSKGRVWIGSDLGVSRYQEKFDSRNIPAPSVELLYMDVNGRKLPLDSVNKLSYDTNNLIFHFRGISFIDEKAIFYKYKLEGFDEDWIGLHQSNSLQIRYTNLSPGRYQFHLRAQNASGVPSAITSSHEIIIQKPFWMKGYSHLLAVILLGFIIYSVIKYFSEKRYSSQLENQVQERTVQLRASEKRYRQMFENNKAVMLLLDPESKAIVDANPAACDYYGYPLEKMKASSFDDLNSTASEQYSKKCELEGTDESTHLILRHKLAASEIRDVEIYSCAINIQEKKLLFLIIHDITDRIQAELALAAEKELLTVTLRSIGDGVISTNIKGQIVLMNKVAERLTGWTESAAMGRSIRDVFNIIDEKTRKRSINPVEEVIEKGIIVGLANHTLLIARDGTERVIADSGAPIRDKDSKVIGVVLVFRDITAQSKLEEELLKASRLDSIGILAGGIAHDFNNILTAILGNISLARLDVDPENSVYEMLSEAEKATFRAKELTQQLLTFSKGDVPIKEIIDIKDLIKDSANFALRGSNVSCKFAIQDDLRLIEADLGQIVQVVNNLTINADQAMPQGGTIRIRAENVFVDLEQALPLKAGRYIMISVQDHGVGIPDELLQKIFDPYFTTKQKGSGLGLTSSYSIIKKHDGYIGVESKMGAGTCFSIYLPAAKKEALPPKSEIEMLLFGKGKILVMDDEAVVRKIAGKMLRHLGYEVDFAEDGAGAIELYKQAKEFDAAYDIVIMDLTIPGGMGGKEAIGKLLEFDPEIKAIVSSGYSTDPIMANFKKYGFIDFITKPYKIEDLSTTVHSAMDNPNDDFS